MSSTPPPPRGHSEPPDQERARPSGVARGDAKAKRPRFLVVALAFALVFGAGCWTEGCSRLAFFRGEREHQANLTSTIRDDGDRARSEALYQRFVDVSDASRGRAVPLAAATFVLGAALLALAARGLAGKSNTRSALMQVVAAQAILVVAGYFVTREMLSAEADWQYETMIMHQREHSPPEQFAQVAATLRATRRWGPPAWLVFRTIASALIVVALSRPRSREFFDAAAGPLSER